jgi:cytochrome c-type biogenesis protein
MINEFPFLVAFWGGILSFLSPCVLPLVPGYLSYIAGVRIEDISLNNKEIKNKVFFASLFFIAGFSFIFIALGAGASGIAPLIISYKNILTKISSILIIVLGLHVLGLFKINFLYREFRFNPEINEIRSVITPFILGIAFGLGWTPCIGPILASVLVLASSQKTVFQGMILLSLYAAGMGIPFLISALIIEKFQEKSIFLKRHLNVIEKIAGILLLLTGIFIFLGELQSLGGLILDFLPFLNQFG